MNSPVAQSMSQARSEILVESTFAVEDMFCGGCAATVERAVRRLPGVVDVSVSFLGDTAIVQHDSSRIGDVSIRKAIGKLGYATRAVDEKQAAAQTSRFEKQLKIRLGVALGFGLWVMMASMVRLFIGLPTEQIAFWVAVFSGVVSLPVLLYSAAPFLKLGWLGLRQRVPGMDSLIFIATVGAVTGSVITLALGGSHVWFDVPVMLVIFQLLARLADFGAHRKASNAVRALLDLSPVQARRIDDNRQVTLIPLRDLKVGDLIQVYAGERICMDGVVSSGTAHLDTGMLNGEAVPVVHTAGDEVFAGTLNLDGLLTIRVDNIFGERRIDVLANAVGRMLNKKTHLMRVVDNVAFWLVPGLLFVAAVVLLFMLITGHEASGALERSLAVLVVCCPCALSLAVPLVVSVTAARAAREGIVLRDPGALEKAGKLDTVLLDKTGTLTTGQPHVVGFACCASYTRDQLVELAARTGYGSRHPLMVAIRRACTVEQSMNVEDERHEHAGKGVECRMHDGRLVVAGSRAWLESLNMTSPDTLDRQQSDLAHASEVCVGIDGQWAGTIYIHDELRPDADALVSALKKKTLHVLLVSGDRTSSVEATASALDIDFKAQMSPEDKAGLVEQLNNEGRVVAFVGDGLNDGPALSASALGIATGQASDLARSAAALAVLDGGLDRVVYALTLTARASFVLRSNLVWALLYNSLLLPAAILGYVHPVMAVVAMGLSTISVSLNSLRAGMGSTTSRSLHEQFTSRPSLEH